MKTSILDMWCAASSCLPGKAGKMYPKADMHNHYFTALIAHVEYERAAITEQRIQDYKRYQSISQSHRDTFGVSSYRQYECPELDYKKFAVLSTETLSLINKCRRTGLFEFLRGQQNSPDEVQIRNVMHYMMHVTTENNFDGVSSVITTINRAFDFEDTHDYTEMNAEVASGLRAAISFLIENPDIRNYAAIAVEPVMRNPESGDMVVEYFKSRFPNMKEAWGFDLDALYEYLENPAPALAVGAL